MNFGLILKALTFIASIAVSLLFFSLEVYLLAMLYAILALGSLHLFFKELNLSHIEQSVKEVEG